MKELLPLFAVLFYMMTCLKYGFASVGIALLGVVPAHAQALETSAIEQQQGAIQDQITQGITSGTMSAAQIAALQARIQALGAGGTGNAANAAATARSAGLGTVGLPTGETLRPLNSQSVLDEGAANRVQQTQGTAKTQTGPDPFTYNTLGPDAYQAQKYSNPAYTVPAYPTTTPQPQGTEQQYTQPSAGAPYGAGYEQAPGAGGAASQVYVYHPSMSR